MKFAPSVLWAIMLTKCTDVDNRLWQWFSSVDADRSGAVTAEELQQCLINGDWSRMSFSKSIVVSLSTDVAMGADDVAFDLDTVKLLMSIFVSLVWSVCALIGG